MLTLLLAAAIASLTTPVIVRMASRWGIVDQPGPRSVHKKAVPLLGGIALYLAFSVAVFVYFGWTDPQVIGILIGGLFILAVGVIDDTARFWGDRLRWARDSEGRGLRPAGGLVFEVAAAVVLYLYGLQIQFIHILIGPTNIPPVLSLVLTILWVVALTNAMNLIDGLDGLTAGVCAIASFVLLVTAVRSGHMPDAAILSAALLGSSLGFVPWNFFPARIFMGDGGALFLGYALAAIAIIGPIKSATAMSLAVPILALGLPVVDTAVSIVRRLRSRQPVGQADRGHLHHRLLDMGLSHRGAVMALYVMSGWLGVGAIAVQESGWLLGSGIVAFILVSAVVLARLVRSAGFTRRSLNSPAQPQNWFSA